MKTGFDATDSNMENMITQTGTDLLNQMMIYAIKNACVYASTQCAYIHTYIHTCPS